ncbi:MULTISPECIES: hypothetical protein [unclassified Salinibacterium]|uniref:hypothetical protein n=1 Tax=unclassified Salinibacterium TaxID=2632331 RepID=UPI0027DA1DFF|nr:MULTISPECIES: hypothetical protein [unclassified Salinibacterium]
MSIFRRRPRLNLGKFKAPEPVEEAPIERVVEEGVLIARNAVRMAVKNRIIVDAARDHLDYDDGALAGLVHVEFDHLAEQTEPLLRGSHTDRNRAVQAGLAEGLRQASMNGELISAIIDEARELAWSEIGTAIIAKLRDSYIPTADPQYLKDRDTRLRELRTINLAELEAAAQGEY